MFAMIAVVFTFGYWAFGHWVIFQFIEKIDAMASNFVFAAVPLFVFMGAMLEKSGIADRLLSRRSTSGPAAFPVASPSPPC